MRSDPSAKPASRIPARPILLGVVVVGLAMSGLALLAEAMAGDGGTVYLTRIDAGRNGRPNQPSIEVTGSGLASAPADSAILQLLIVQGVAYGGTLPTPGPGGSQDALAPIVAVIVAEGVDASDVHLVFSPSLISVCDGVARCASVRVDVAIAQPTRDRLNAIVDAAGAKAAAAGMTVQDVGVGYALADCTELAHRARALATTDARRRAADQAAVLGVTLGNLVFSSEPAPAVPQDGHGCNPPVPVSGDSWWTPGSVGLTVPAFDPAAPPDATVTVQVSLAFVIAITAASTSQR